MSFNFRLTFIFVVFALWSITNGVEAKERTLEFSTISFGERPKDLWYEKSGELIELKAGGSVRGSKYSYTGDGSIAFYKLVPDGAGGSRRVLQGQASIPEGIDQALLCFFPNARPAQGKLPWNIYIMDDSITAFGGGDIRFVNFSSQPVVGVLDGETLRLKPGALETVVPDSNKEKGVGVKLAAYLGEKWEPFFSARWPYREKVRLLVLFLPDESTGKVSMKAIPQPVRNAS
ncbi:hypothetical protein [Rubellicoccus peritrichatus]|uniref:Uncharacterized protein n=1 Tax=Rubellicoccus peritrichatus TaxID=3080537 RepID=A0AAQ3L5E7_9BACT|nr:hypothetical protein [Puniceicoccus sp. CR14]WOO39749.1 hypothetical protein RZN69_14085 [Puniceicoccus sp. CR14]